MRRSRGCSVSRLQWCRILLARLKRSTTNPSAACWSALKAFGWKRTSGLKSCDTSLTSRSILNLGIRFVVAFAPIWYFFISLLAFVPGRHLLFWGTFPGWLSLNRLTATAFVLAMMSVSSVFQHGPKYMRNKNITPNTPKCRLLLRIQDRCKCPYVFGCRP